MLSFILSRMRKCLWMCIMVLKMAYLLLHQSNDASAKADVFGGWKVLLAMVCKSR